MPDDDRIISHIKANNKKIDAVFLWKESKQAKETMSVLDSFGQEIFILFITF